MRAHLRAWLSRRAFLRAAAGTAGMVYPLSGTVAAAHAGRPDERSVNSAALSTEPGSRRCQLGENTPAPARGTTLSQNNPLPSFRFPLEEQPARVAAGGTAKEATVAKFPVSKNIAGVSMRLDPGGLRELHWHANAAEWGYVLSGSCRTTLIDPDGRWAIDEFGEGDVWYFPRGYGHSIQGLEQGCHFILIFDNGAFSENATFSLTDWLAHTPRYLVESTFKLSTAEAERLPKQEVYIAAGPVPPPLPSFPARASQNPTPQHHRFPLLGQTPRRFNGGTIRTVSRREFPVSTTITGALQELEPGATRELHWHPDADEWQYYIAGQARMTVFASQGQARTEEFRAGDVGYVPMGYGHYIENTGDERCTILIGFNYGLYTEISATGWLASNPALVVATNLGLPVEVVERMPRAERWFVPNEPPR